MTSCAGDVGAGARRARDPQNGATLAELLIVLAMMMVVGAMAAASVGNQRDELAAGGAARYVGTLLQRGRMEAIRRAAHVAFKFEGDGSAVRYALFADGNRNGVRTEDVGNGTDPQVSPWDCLSDHFAGVTFSISPGVRDIDSGSLIVNGDPVRVGGSDLLSFSPTGTATSGTLYLSGRTGQQYAVRVLGATGRIRILRFNRGKNEWTAP